MLVMLIGATLTSGAQQQRWTIQPGEHITAALPPDAKYVYPQFTNGTVFFRNNTQSSARLNLSLLTGEMQFIDSRGDTMAIDNEATVRHVVVQADTFYFDKVFVQLIQANPVAKLAKQDELRIGDIKKMGAYGQSSSISSISTVTSVRSSNLMQDLTVNKEMVIVKERNYFFGTPYNHFLPANRRNLLKLFGTHQKAISQYLTKHKPNFRNEADLIALLAFINHL